MLKENKKIINKTKNSIQKNTKQGENISIKNTNCVKRIKICNFASYISTICIICFVVFFSP